MTDDQKRVAAVRVALERAIGCATEAEEARAVLAAFEANGYWLAPWDATAAMRRPRPFPTEWSEYRDAYLAECEASR